MYLLEFVILILFLNHNQANWQLIDFSFNGQQILQNYWKTSQCCSNNKDDAVFDKKVCSENQLEYLKLSNQQRHLWKSFNSRCFQVQLICEVFFDGATDQNSKLMISFRNNEGSDIELYQVIYQEINLDEDSRPICQKDPSRFKQEIIISNQIESNTNNFEIQICFDPFDYGCNDICDSNPNTDYSKCNDSYLEIGIRNLLIYINTCYSTCLTCNGTSKTNCLTCFDNQSPINGECKCISQNQFSDTHVGCRQECSRNNQMANVDKICVQDNRIIANFTLNSISFNSLIFKPDIFYPKKMSDIIEQPCLYPKTLRYFNNSEGMIYQMNLESAVKFLRIRITFLLNIQQGSKIVILYNDQFLSRIEKGTSDFYIENAILIFQKNYCNPQQYPQLRLEMTFQLFNSNPVFLIQGQLQGQSEFWGFENMTVDIGFCQQNCLNCIDFSTCSQCKFDYKLYKNKCVLICPIHSSNCIDYEDIIRYSRYLVKGFYDLNMTVEQIKRFYDSTPEPSHVYKQQFSFLNNKIVLGGLQTWNSGSYIKTWTINKSHYAVTVYFNLTFGDGYSGSFYYKIGTQRDSFQGPFNNDANGKNLIGRQGLENIFHFNVSLPTFQDNSLYVEFKCEVSTPNISKEFCAISDYFIVVHYCPPFCLNCNNINECLDTNYNSQICANNQYLEFNTETEDYTCITCNQRGCSTCKNAEVCTQCVSDLFYLANGICLCDKFTFLQNNNCSLCYKYCKTCYGSSQFDCLTCIPEYYREIKINQCVCLPGYYDDQINLPCVPICGDQIKVESEECDDGNNNPYDGCHNCKFSCNFACDICINGKCYLCKNGYEIHNNDCYPICNDELLVYPEQCEYKIESPFENCLYCQYKCKEFCIDCQFGICQKCNEQNGWYLQQDGSCKNICGDNILVLEVEECDNNNLHHNCNQCQITCDKNCLYCNRGICIQCAKGYSFLESTQQCIQICENGILAKKDLICEDGNNLLNDGCYLCQLNCQSSCTSCSQNGCLECNQIGWKLNEEYNKCETVCGDGIIVQNYEECDDLIDENCYQCQYYCQDSCLICRKGNCLKCKRGWLLKIDKICYPKQGDSLVVGNEQCDDNNTIMFDGCYQSQYQCQQSCIECKFGQCNQCQKGYQIIGNLCHEILNDGIIIGKEQCDDMNFEAQDGCHNTKFECSKDCEYCYQGQCLKCNQLSSQLNTLTNKCISVCGDGQLSQDEQCDDANIIPYDGCYQCQFQCNQYCDKCNQGLCSQCQFGYYLDIIKNICFSICGDGIITQDEQCDDGSLPLIQNCKNCKLQCQQQCITCIDGQCLKCISPGWELNLINMNCQTICGDQLILGNEQCDDGNNYNDDGCIDCYLQCQDQCTLCFQGFCKECNTKGWQIQDNKCITVCGDQLILDIEECDDGNLIPYDGCYQCKFQCQNECIDCQKGICNACESGYILNQQKNCIIYCGDEIVVIPYEQCDDGNDVPFDGCYQCYFQCSEGCIDCEEDQCKQCNSNQYILDYKTGTCQKQNLNNSNDSNDDVSNQLILYQTLLRCGNNQLIIDYVCVNQCGNGILINQYEECDDGNNVGGDGCSTYCLIEDSYSCINSEGSLSLCTFIIAPDFILDVVSDKTQSIQIIEFTFNQQVKLSQEINFEQFVIFTITPQTQYQLTINCLSNLTTTLNNPNYQIIIEFIEPILNPILSIDIDKSLIQNEFQLNLLNNQKKVNLGTPIVLPQTTKQKLTSIVQLNDIMMYSMATISSLAFLTGNAIMFFNLLDLLQSLSYIRFMQCQFPPHLIDFLNTYTKVSLQPILNQFKVDQFLEKLNGGKLSNQTNNQSQQDPKIILKQLFLFNAKSCYFSVFASILTYAIYCLLSSQNLSRFVFKIYTKYNENFKILKLIHLFQTKVQKLCLSSKFEYFSVGIFKVYQAILHQFTFSILLQFPYYQFDSPFEIFNSINAILGFLFMLISLYPLLSITTYQIKNKSKWKYFYHECKTSFWAIQFKSFQIYKIQFYILIITELINYPEAQSIMLSVQSFIFLIYLIKFKPLTSNFELSKQICREFLFMITTGTFLIYSFDISEDDFILLGWIHIGFFCAILASNMIIDLTLQIQKIYDSYLKKKLKQKIEEEKKYEGNHLQIFQINQNQPQLLK